MNLSILYRFDIDCLEYLSSQYSILKFAIPFLTVWIELSDELSKMLESFWSLILLIFKSLLALGVFSVLLFVFFIDKSRIGFFPTDLLIKTRLSEVLQLKLLRLYCILKTISESLGMPPQQTKISLKTLMIIICIDYKYSKSKDDGDYIQIILSFPVALERGVHIEIYLSPDYFPWSWTSS